MEINYAIIGLTALVVVVLVIFLARKNYRDGKDLEKKLNEPEVKPEEHKDVEPM